ncbi:MAG: Eco57I restriction-modification methylase domain-containing protein [Prevotella sp.]|nr:Eco57I restriction-modification methylase domain-containing protein [Prevotella sp.]
MEYKEVIESKYNRGEWLNLLYDIFKQKTDFKINPRHLDINSPLAKEALYLGQITLSDDCVIAVYEVELTDKVDIQRNRRGLRDMLVTDWHNVYDGAFMFCYRKNEDVYRFSYVSDIWEFDKQKQYERKITNTKRYTYLLGEGRSCRTAIEQFDVLKKSKQTLSDVTAAFSVETLTKQFYNDLFQWYQWVIGPSSNVSFQKKGMEKDSIETKIIRMITRLMFVWFIKQKGLIPNKIFDIDYLDEILKDFDPYSQTEGNYYQAILQNLFFATLNRAIVDENGNKREFATNKGQDVKTSYRYAELFKISEAEVIDLFAEVPFLNGGLFECLDKSMTIDGVEKAYKYDGFTRNDNKEKGHYTQRAVVPNNLFFDEEKGLISIFNRYNFTIEENTPQDQQVALDPELLGKVFENLLGAYNPETKETARNQSGSFYTPREIVNYMVDESLIAYLGDTPFVRSLFRNDFSFDESNVEEYRKIADKLQSIKILDPACGSGAFPMGILNRMIDILSKISPDENVYDLKLRIIENCIYGSDIQCIATQISKLRFFISLICDCEKDSSKPNFGIPTLPNLETKFVAADSLIEKKKHQRKLFDNPEIDVIKKKLTEIRHNHFSAKTTSKKINLRKQDKELRKKLAELLADENYVARQDAKQLADWNPYDQNSSADFFDPEWMFGITDGFDIIVGNPPYIQLQNNGGELAKKYEPCKYNTFARTGDIYCLFYERGYNLLKSAGHLCYITSNKWMREGYGEKIRGFLAKSTNPKLLIDFAGVKIFESATVDTNILLLSRESNRHKTLCAITNKQNKDSIKNLGIYIQEKGTINDFSSSDSWVILSPMEQNIKQKIEAVGTPLNDWNIQINYGIKTGCNEAFIITTEKRNEILANCKTQEERNRTEELIQPILRGRDIKRYGYNWANLWLINTHNGIKGKLSRIRIERYPAIKHWLDNGGIAFNGKVYKGFEQLKKRADQGDTPYNLRNCAYLEDFTKNKIAWASVGSTFYSLITKGMVLLDTNYFFAIDDERMAYYLLGILNSKLFTFWINSVDTPIGTGGAYRHYKYNIEKASISKPENPNIIGEYVEKILNIIESKQSIPDCETAINKIVFSLYGLNEEEISYIED